MLENLHVLFDVQYYVCVLYVCTYISIIGRVPFTFIECFCPKGIYFACLSHFDVWCKFCGIICTDAFDIAYILELFFYSWFLHRWCKNCIKIRSIIKCYFFNAYTNNFNCWTSDSRIYAKLFVSYAWTSIITRAEDPDEDAYEYMDLILIPYKKFNHLNMYFQGTIHSLNA